MGWYLNPVPLDGQETTYKNSGLLPKWASSGMAGDPVWSDCRYNWAAAVEGLKSDAHRRQITNDGRLRIIYGRVCALALPGGGCFN